METKRPTHKSPRLAAVLHPVRHVYKWAKAHPRRSAAIGTAVLLVGGGGVLAAKAYSPVGISPLPSPLQVATPVVLQLNQTLGTVDTSKITVSPAVAGTWQHKRGNLLASDQLVFTPDRYFTANTTYTVTLPTAPRLLFGDTTLPSVDFTTEKAPSLATAGMNTLKDGQVIAADSNFVATLASKNHGLRTLSLQTNPEIPLTMESTDDTTYTWKPDGLLPADTDITVELIDTKNNEQLLKKTVHVAAVPRLSSPLSRGGVDERDTIDLTFAQAIKRDTAKITFDLPGKGVWRDDNTYVFTPDTLRPGSTYTYTIAAGLRSSEGGITTDDITGEFSTFGAVAVIATTPRGNELSQSQQTLSFTFDRPVDQSAAVQRLSVSSGTITGTSWKGNTLSVTVTNLGYQNNFSATIAAGVPNASFGLPSNRPYSLAFTTEVRSARLSVPYFAQQHSATCTAASLRMALAYRGVGSDEIGLVNAMGYAPRDIDKSTDPPTWDDPQTMFVGSIDGSIAAGTGAGPDAPPVAKAARAYGRGADVAFGVSTNWLAQQLYNGNPVIMFGAFRNTGTTTWKTPDGQTRVMNLTGHATVVVGVKGEPHAPLGFWINDPLKGTYYWTTAQVAANISLDPDRQAVVVY